MGLVAVARHASRADALRFDGHDLLAHLATRERRALIGKDIAMIFQEPTTSLNPCFTVGFQLMRDAAPALSAGPRRRARRARDRAAASRSASRPPRARLDGLSRTSSPAA